LMNLKRKFHGNAGVFDDILQYGQQERRFEFYFNATFKSGACLFHTTTF